MCRPVDRELHKGPRQVKVDGANQEEESVHKTLVLEAYTGEAGGGPLPGQGSKAGL